MIKHFLGPGIIYVLGTQEPTDKNGGHSKTNNCNRVGKHLFRINTDAVDMKERASDLGPAGWVEVGLVKKKSKILQGKETAVQRPRIVPLVRFGEKEREGPWKPAWPSWNQGAWDKRGGLKLERQEGSSHDKLWVGTPRDLEFIPRAEGSHWRSLSGEETNWTGSDFGIRMEDGLEVCNCGLRAQLGATQCPAKWLQNLKNLSIRLVRRG